jgi:beta-hydroxylase
MQADQRTQRLATEGIAPMARVGIFARIFMIVVEFSERLNLRYAKFGNPFVYDNALFPWVADIERNWKLIRSELDRVIMRRSELRTFRTSPSTPGPSHKTPDGRFSC